MNSKAAFDMIERMYRASAAGTSFLNYFWSCRALLGGLYSVLLAPLPIARLYHSISTGYAGLLLARATLTTGRPGFVTEHGIYTNERRIEITLAEWLSDNLPVSLSLPDRRRNLRDFWIRAFQGYSRICYEACSKIITLYGGNQILQLRDGAPPDRLMVIPNGIDCASFASVRTHPNFSRPTVALIGRVVPIKDIMTFIRAAGLLRQTIPEVRLLVLGPTDEDPVYFRECQQLASQLGLADHLTFTGRVNIRDYLKSIDVIVLTSISEAQPLVLLEAGAAGIPSVATDVGSCRELLYGRPDEKPALGQGGLITPLADPSATAAAVTELLCNPDFYWRCSRTAQERVNKYYNKTTIDGVYRDLYQQHIQYTDTHTIWSAC